MRRKRALLLALVCVSGLAAIVIHACSATKVSGTVTSSFSGEPLDTSWDAFVDMMDEWGCGCTADTLAEQECAEGRYSYTGQMPGDYTVSAWAYGYQSESTAIALGAGGNVTCDFALDPVPANIVANVTGLDQEVDGDTGGWRTVYVDITYQEMAHYPERLVVWAYSAVTGTTKIFDSDDQTSMDLSSYEYTPAGTTNPTWDGYDTTLKLAFPWCTYDLPNASFTLEAALVASDMHGDGTDIDPDPVATHWVHAAGAAPAAWEGADGTAGGTTHGVGVENVVIESYGASPGTGDYFKYDPEGTTGGMASPTVTVEVANWRDEPMEIVVWMTPTAWGDTRPGYGDEATMALSIAGPGTYALTWDGSNSNLGLGPGESEWGTYSYDIDACKPYFDPYWMEDWFQAKTHDGFSGEYDIHFGEHDVEWDIDDTTGDSELLCWYKIQADYPIPPTHVNLIAIDPTLAEKATLPLTSSADLTLGHRHPADPSPGYGVHTTSNYQETDGVWRVVLTGQTNSGAELRRDRTNPPMLATNGRVKPRRPLVVMYSSSMSTNLADRNALEAALKGIVPNVTSYGMVAAQESAVAFFAGTDIGTVTAQEPNAALQAWLNAAHPVAHFASVTRFGFNCKDGKTIGIHNGRAGTVAQCDLVVVDPERVTGVPGDPQKPVPSRRPSAATPAQDGTAYKRFVLHELGHAMGLKHDEVPAGCVCHTTFNTHKHICVMSEIAATFFWTFGWNNHMEFEPAVDAGGADTRWTHRKKHVIEAQDHMPAP